MLLVFLPLFISASANSLIPSLNRVVLHGNDNTRTKRAATAKKERIWPDGIIPFVVTANFSGDHRNLFVRAMRHWENHTCVSFVPREAHHKHYIMFTVDKCGCCSYVGRRGDGPQAISIGKNCDKFGIVVHELGHVVGFWHEHTRPDRDKYVDIFYKSIQPGQDYNFDKAKPDEVNSLSEPYDFNSIMHYARDTFSRGAFHDTILPKPNSEIGQRIQLSEGDIRQAMKLYKCPTCGGSLLEETASLVAQSAGKCIWRIIAPAGNTIFLNVTGKFLPVPKGGCVAENANYIAVKDGYSARAPLLDKICGDEISYRTVVSSTNRLYVEMKTPNLPPEPIGIYFSVCGGPIDGNEGVIQSPRYPEAYPPGADCLWTIRVPEGFQLAIHLEQHKDCIYDRTIFTEGGAEGPVIDTLCGQLEDIHVVTKASNSMGIRFISDNSVQKMGFELRFERELDECTKGDHDCEQLCLNTIGGFTCDCREGFSLRPDRKTCESTCGGSLKGQKGFISSPMFPSFYPPNKNCIWNIQVEEGQHIYLNFTSFNIEGLKSECTYDYVRIGNGEKMCGELTQPLLLAFHTNQLRMEFASDSSVERRGFSAQFIADIDECQENNGGCEQICRNRLGSYECGCQPGFVLVADGHNCKEGGCFFELNAPSGEISSPDYPQEYPKNLNCTWHFVTTPGHRLMLTFSSFQVEEHSQCKYDAVSIYDGGDSTANLAGVYCGVTTPPLLLSTSNQLFLTFSSDASVSRRGFDAQYASVCGGSLTPEESVGHIYSHAAYSDSRYPKGQDCWWRISASSQQRSVRLSFSSFHIEHDVGCQYDYVEIYDGLEKSSSTLVGKYCGDKIPLPFYSSSSSLLLIFHTDDSEDEKGFVAEYREVSKRVGSN